MLPFSPMRLAAGLGGRLLKAGPAREIRALSTDTRTLRRGDAYLALKGPRFDGEKFFAQALKKGASVLIGRRPPLKAGAVQVEAGLPALQRLAAEQRRLFSGPVIALTGSNGKSSTKDCLAWLLGGEARVLSTPGNWNNEVGLPLTLLGLRPRHRAMVLELGMNHAGELAALTRICRPSVGVELNVGDAHLGHFGSRAKIAAAKEELLQAMGPGGVAVVNADDPLCAAMGRRFKGRVVRFGRARGAELRLLEVNDGGFGGLSFKASWLGRNFTARMRMGGRARLQQGLAGLAAALAAGLAAGPASGLGPGSAARRPAGGAGGPELEALLSRLASWRPSGRARQQQVKAGGLTWIRDEYNASPQSMSAGLELLAASAPAGKRVAALGSMLELGSAAPRLHRELGAAARRLGVDRLAALGPSASALLEGFGGAAGRGRPGAKAAAFGPGRHAEAAAWLRAAAPKGAWVLLKGSRGMRMERVFEAFTRTVK